MNQNQYSKIYEDVASAIKYLADHAQDQPTLTQAAKAVGLSDEHLQKIFSRWVGLSPKQFLKYISLERAKSTLRDTETSIMQTSLTPGLSGSGRLHDLFVTVESKTPGQYKSLQLEGGKQMAMNYTSAPTPYGLVVIATTKRGLSHLSFISSDQQALPRLKETFPFALFTKQQDEIQSKALEYFENPYHHKPSSGPPLKIHLSGTSFQIKVWKSLLTIPSGTLSTYGTLAKTIGKPKAFRAVGTAVGKNPIAYIIPCHRIIKSSGEIGNYMWGSQRKMLMIAREASEQTKGRGK